MGVSVCYRFTSENDLSTALLACSKLWDDEFDGTPYESWCWYEPHRAGALHVYQGATSPPPDEERAVRAFLAALRLLSGLRRKVGGEDWAVHVDDAHIPWDEGSASFNSGF